MHLQPEEREVPLLPEVHLADHPERDHHHGRSGPVGSRCRPACSSYGPVLLDSNLPVGSGLDHCVASGTADANASNDVLPPSGLGFWYLVRGRNSCGPGTYGFESDGTERVSSVCP